MRTENFVVPVSAATSEAADPCWVSTDGEADPSSSGMEEELREVESRLFVVLDGIPGLGDLMSRHRLDHRATRVRTTLILLIARLGRGSNDNVIRAAELIELEHLAFLFHTDGVVDGPDQTADSAVELARSNSVAILSGDMILARANLVATALGPSATKLTAEMMERFFVSKLQAHTSADEEGEYRHVRTLSATAGSVFATAARMALIFSKAPAVLEEPITMFAERLGVAFQLAEDNLHASSSLPSGAMGDAERLEAQSWALSAMNAITKLPACSATNALRDFADSTLAQRI